MINNMAAGARQKNTNLPFPFPLSRMNFISPFFYFKQRATRFASHSYVKQRATRFANHSYVKQRATRFASHSYVNKSSRCMFHRLLFYTCRISYRSIFNYFKFSLRISLSFLICSTHSFCVLSPVTNALTGSKNVPRIVIPSTGSVVANASITATAPVS